MPKFYIKGLSFALLLRIVLFSLIAGVVVLFFKQNIVTYPQVKLSLQTARPELIQIFCDDGFGFNEALSRSVKTTTEQQNGKPINLLLPSSCKRLRLDLGDKGAVIKIISASLITSSGDQVDILSKILFPASLNEINASESNQGVIIATGNDPYVVLRGDYSIPTATGYSVVALFKMLGIFLIVLGTAALISYVASKRNLKLNTFLVNGHIPLIIIVIAGALFRIFYWVGSALPSEPDQLWKMWPDEGTYFSIAQYIMTHGLRDYFFAEQSVMAAPVNPIYIALMYTVTNSVNAIRAINLLLSLLSIVLVYKLGKKMFNKPVGLLAAGICAIHGQLIQYSATLLTEPLFLCILLAGIYLLVLTLKTQNLPRFQYLRYALATATLLTLAILTRSIAMLLPLFLFAVIGALATYRRWSGGIPSFPLLKRATLPLLLPIIIVGVVATKNYVVFDRFMVATGAGAVLWLGSRADTEGDEPPYRGRPYDIQIITHGASHLSLQGDALLMDAGKQNIRENTIGYVWWCVKRIGRLVVGSNLAWFYPQKNIFDWYPANGRDEVATANEVFQIILATVIALYGTIGLWVTPKREFGIILLVGTAIYFVVFSVPFMTNQRLGLPLVMLLVIPTAAVLNGAWLGEGKQRLAALVGMPFVFAIVLDVLFLG